ncbi:MAG: hypothetical protein NC823_00665 [Candidatus Omnitrophica bacterium]|nr:hypothetical protein [Candidatus Omnitrophota bacterium]
MRFLIFFSIVAVIAVASLVLITSQPPELPLTSLPQSSLPSASVAKPAEGKSPAGYSVSLVQPKQEKKEPEWRKTALSLYEKYGEKGEKTRSEIESKKEPESASSTVTVMSSAPAAASEGITRVTQSSAPGISQPGTIPTQSTSPAATSSSDTALSSSGSAASLSPEKQSDTTQETQVMPGQTTAIFVTRSIKVLSSGFQVTLNITIGEHITGLIVTEVIPEGYAIYSANPNYAKKVGNKHSWLFYGTSLSNQQIVYEIRGLGTGAITGSFTSSRGSGIITGDVRVGGQS